MHSHFYHTVTLYTCLIRNIFCHFRLISHTRTDQRHNFNLKYDVDFELFENLCVSPDGNFKGEVPLDCLLDTILINISARALFYMQVNKFKKLVKIKPKRKNVSVKIQVLCGSRFHEPVPSNLTINTNQSKDT